MSFELTPEQLSQAKAILAVFQERFPKTFFSNAKEIRPLKIDIHHDLYAVFAEHYPKKAINRTLKLYTRQSDYFSVLTLGAQRVDLEGKPSGEVLQEHIEIAVDAKARQQRRDARKEAREQSEEQTQKVPEQIIPDNEEEAKSPPEKTKSAGRTKLGLKKRDKPNTLLKMRVEKTVKEKSTLKLSTQTSEQSVRRRISTQAARISRKQLDQRRKEKELSQLPFGKMEVRVKIEALPDEVKTVKHGWHQFTVKEGKYFAQVTVRPRTWKKLQEAPTRYPYWVANITGKMGPRLKGEGFELLEPVTQVFERKPDPEESEKTQAKSNQDNV